MSDYPLIADHGLIGDLQTSALVATDGSIDWFCAPRFDSPSIFGALLDHDRGGHFRVRPTVEAFTSKQLYFPDTAILVTRFMTEAGVGEVRRLHARHRRDRHDRHRLVRMVRCVRGEMTFAVDIAPRFDYGREPHETHLTEDGVVFEGVAGTSMMVSLVREPDDERLAQIRVDDATATCTPRSPSVPDRCAAWCWRPGRPDRPSGAGGRGVAALRRDGRLLGVLARPVDVLRPVAGGAGPLRDHAQADDLRAERRARGRTDRRAARADRRRAQLGLPLHLGPGRLVLGVRAARHGLQGRGRRARALAARPGRRAGRRSGAARSTSCTASTAPAT